MKSSTRGLRIITATAVTILSVSALVFVHPTPTVFAQEPPTRAHDEAIWQRVYCDGMQLEQHVPSGGYVDCLSREYAIEVEWAKHWAEAVGQSLYYAGATNRKPGIILLCEQSEGLVEGLCRSYVYRLEYALKFVNAHVYVWTCAIDKDRTLNDCFRPEIQPTTEPSPQTATP